MLEHCGLVIFTDGSRRSERAGASCVIPQLNLEFSQPLGNHTTVMQAEIYALVMAVSVIRMRGFENQSIAIVSDSKFVLHMLKGEVFRTKLSGECWDKLQEVGMKNNITLIWCPAHAGVQGNSRADVLAKEAAMKEFMGPLPVLGISLETLKEETVKRLGEEQKTFWSNCQGCRQAKALISRPSLMWSNFLLNLNRTDLRAVVGVFTGHFLNYHLFRMGLVTAASCRGCGVALETVEHFLWECPTLDTCREEVAVSVEEQDCMPGKILKYIQQSEWF